MYSVIMLFVVILLSFSVAFVSLTLSKEHRGTSGVHFNKWRNIFFSDSSYTLLDLYEVSSLLLYTQFCAKLDSAHFFTG